MSNEYRVTRDNEKNLTKSIEYDSFNRIKQVVDPDTGDLKGEYEYDDQGFRVRKFAVKQGDDGSLKNVEILYPSMYFGVEKDYKNGKKVESVSAVNNVYLNGVRVAAVSSDNQARFYLTDQVDSVKVVLDDTGDVVTRMEYLPYGETWFQEGDESNKPKYNSQELDEEANFYFYNARHYDPEIARFVTADTVIDGETSAFGWNRYMYTHGNPIKYKDPTGHLIEEFKNWRKGNGWTDNETVKQGQEMESRYQNDKNFLRESKLQTEKNIAKLEVKGYNTEKLRKRITDLRNKYNCNAEMNKVDKALLEQYKEFDLTGKKDTKVVKPLKNSSITSGYRTPSRPNHSGVDFGKVPGGNEGKSILAAKGGVVLYTRYQSGHDGEAGGGLYTRIRNNDGTHSYYMHSQKLKVEAGQKINAGDTIGYVGNTGSETLDVPMDPHLHYQELDSKGKFRRPIEVENLYK